MGIYDKIKNVFKCTKKEFMPPKRVLLYCFAALFLFLILIAATEYYMLPMEARSGADFNLRSIHPLTSYADRGETVPLKFNVFTHSPGLYELKVYSPEGKLVFRSLKSVRKNDFDAWTITSELEAQEFGQYAVELSGIFNKNENKSYRTSFWIEELSKRQQRFSESEGSEGKLSADSRNNPSITENLIEELEPVSFEFSEDPEDDRPVSLENESVPPVNLTDNGSIPVKEPGSLYINSIPIGSTIYLNGHDMGRTPLNIDNLPVGDYSLILELDGYEALETKVDVLAGQTTTVYQPLAKIQPSDDTKKPLITALHIKAFIIFMIAGFFVYVIIEVLLKDANKVR
ncbi:PEGA domain-containing protein [Methanosarcina sp. T3]|uniref:PEGA domain-containing protein n=1 Tax=Methanosarcina sp. T3 TaxID=3439062 RepID=UPI003F842D52